MSFTIVLAFRLEAICGSRFRNEEGKQRMMGFLTWRSMFIRKASLAAQMIRNLPAVQETQVPSLPCPPPRSPWIGKIPWRRKWQSTPVFLPGESHGQRNWWAPVNRVTQNLKWPSTAYFSGSWGRENLQDRDLILQIFIGSPWIFEFTLICACKVETLWSQANSKCKGL